MFRLHGPKSNVTIPLIANGRIFGALAFATLGAERKWREDEIAELKLIAQIIGNVVGRQRAELREEQLRDELAHAMRVATLGELAAALAHELNQPLAAILSNAQAARRFIAGGADRAGRTPRDPRRHRARRQTRRQRHPESARDGQQTPRRPRNVLPQ